MVYRYNGDGIVRGVPSSVTPTVTVVVSPSTVTPTVTVTPSWDSSNAWDMHVEVSTNSEDFDVKYATVTATGFYPQEVSSSEFTGFDVTMTEVPDYVSNLSDGTNDYPIKAKVVADTNSGYDVKMWTGTKAEYDTITTKDNNTLYNITDDNTADAYEAYTKSEVDTGFVNVNASNLSSTGQKVFDGQWVDSYSQLALGITVASATVYTYDLSSYLPDDNYIYEVIVGAIVATTAKTNSLVDIRAYSTLLGTGLLPFISVKTNINTSASSSGRTVLPIGTDRKLFIGVADNASISGSMTIRVGGYRRIGTNS